MESGGNSPRDSLASNTHEYQRFFSRKTNRITRKLLTVIPDFGGLINMAVHIRLTRKGRKKKPFYRIVVADSHAPRDGKFLDVVGTYDPMQEPAAINIDNDKLADWMGKGAQPSTTVKSLLKKSAASGVEAA